MRTAYPADYHLHSNFSPDSETPLEAQAERALQLGMKGFCLTDHAELDLWQNHAWTLDLVKAKAHFDRVAERFPQLEMRFGFEFGMPDEPIESLAEARTHIPDLDYDFKIASVHFVNGVDVFHKPWYEGRSYAASCEAYLKAIYERVQRLRDDEFSVIGHLDCPCKTSFANHGQEDPRVRYRYFADVFDELARHLIARGKSVELNTSAWRKIGDLELPGLDWLSRLRELGAEYVTIGSDAHRPEHLGYRFPEAVELLKAAGFRYYAVFRRMEPILLPLE